jgi:hypothetical protein
MQLGNLQSAPEDLEDWLKLYAADGIDMEMWINMFLFDREAELRNITIEILPDGLSGYVERLSFVPNDIGAAINVLDCAWRNQQNIDSIKAIITSIKPELSGTHSDYLFSTFTMVSTGPASRGRGRAVWVFDIDVFADNTYSIQLYQYTANGWTSIIPFPNRERIDSPAYIEGPNGELFRELEDTYDLSLPTLTELANGAWWQDHTRQSASQLLPLPSRGVLSATNGVYERNTCSE